MTTGDDKGVDDEDSDDIAAKGRRDVCVDQLWYH